MRCLLPELRVYDDPSDRCPGKGVSRREFLAATGGIGAASLAGCTASTETQRLDTTFTQTSGNQLPLTGKPEVVNVDDLGGKVTLKSVKARHEVHPRDTMGGPIALPVVWAF